jgi:hypothetical protein
MTPTRSTVIGRARAHHLDLLALLQHAVDDAHQHDDAEIGVVPAVDQHGLQRRVAVALPAGQRSTMASSTSPRRGRSWPRSSRRRTHRADHVLDLLLDPVGLGGRQVDLVEDRDDLVIGRWPDRHWPASAPRRPGWRRPPAASPRRPPASGTPHRRSRHGPACRSG